MSHELHYTSAPRGLKPGSRGFCTVACTAGLPAPLADRLESLSGYRQVFPPNDPSAGRNPVAWSHLRLSVGGKSLSILSRVGFAGLDYTDRTNKYAHHVAITSDERPSGGPAWLLSQPGFMDSSWTGEPRILPSGRRPPSGDSVASPCHAWASTTGDAGWAGVVVASLDTDPDRPIYLIFEPGMDLLPLVAEALSLLPPARRWDVTFSTYFTGLPSGVACSLRCVLNGSREAAEARRLPNALILDLTAPLGSAPESEFVRIARRGRFDLTSAQSPEAHTASEFNPEPAHFTFAAPPLPVPDTGSVSVLDDTPRFNPLRMSSPSRSRNRGSNRARRRGRKLALALVGILLLVAVPSGIFLLVNRSKMPQSQQQRLAAVRTMPAVGNGSQNLTQERQDRPTSGADQRQFTDNKTQSRTVQTGNDGVHNSRFDERNRHPDLLNQTNKPNPAAPTLAPENMPNQGRAVADGPHAPDVDVPNDGRRNDPKFGSPAQIVLTTIELPPQNQFSTKAASVVRLPAPFQEEKYELKLVGLADMARAGAGIEASFEDGVLSISRRTAASSAGRIELGVFRLNDGQLGYEWKSFNNDKNVIDFLKSALLVCETSEDKMAISLRGPQFESSERLVLPAHKVEQNSERNEQFVEIKLKGIDTYIFDFESYYISKLSFKASEKIASFGSSMDREFLLEDGQAVDLLQGAEVSAEFVSPYRKIKLKINMCEEFINQQIEEIQNRVDAERKRSEEKKSPDSAGGQGAGSKGGQNSASEKTNPAKGTDAEQQLEGWKALREDLRIISGAQISLVLSTKVGEYTVEVARIGKYSQAKRLRD